MAKGERGKGNKEKVIGKEKREEEGMAKWGEEKVELKEKIKEEGRGKKE